MKINLIIPKRNRNERLPVCLHYLNLANWEQRNEVRVIVVDDAPHGIDATPYPNLTLLYLVQPYPQHEEFRKAELFNAGMRAAPQDYDWCALVDIDMVYRPEYFAIMERHIVGASLVICEGKGLNAEESSRVLVARPPFAEINQQHQRPFASPSQVAFSREWYQRYCEVFGTSQLLDEQFRGWGYEDVVLETAASLLARARIARKITVEGVWLHLEHTRDKQASARGPNLALACRLIGEREQQLRDYLRSSGVRRELDRLLDAATEAQLGGEPVRALALARRALQYAPTDATAHQVLGLLLSEQGDNMIAEAHVRQAISCDPGDRYLYVNLSEILRRQGKLDEARMVLRQALVVSFYTPEAHTMLGNMLRQEGKTFEAVEHFRWALALQPDDLATQQRLRAMLATLQSDSVEPGWQPGDAARAEGA